MARFFILALTVAVIAAGSAGAQTPGPQPGPSIRDLPLDLTPRAPQERRPEMRGRTNEPAGDNSKAAAPAPTTLESLYERLAKSKDAQEASAISKQIERRWQRSGSDTTDLLLTRANQAASLKDSETALELYDYIILLRPEWAEPYHRRANLLFGMNDYDGALRDINATLTRDPRHYAAMSGLGLIMQQLDNSKAAYRAFQKALELNPHMESLKTFVDRLKPEVEGQPL